MNVEFHPDAAAEFSEAVDYYEQRQPEYRIGFASKSD